MLLHLFDESLQIFVTPLVLYSRIFDQRSHYVFSLLCSTVLIVTVEVGETLISVLPKLRFYCLNDCGTIQGVSKSQKSSFSLVGRHLRQDRFPYTGWNTEQMSVRKQSLPSPPSITYQNHTATEQVYGLQRKTGSPLPQETISQSRGVVVVQLPYAASQDQLPSIPGAAHDVSCLSTIN